MGKDIFTRLEEIYFCGPTWATENMTFWRRLKFYRDTGEWPGAYSRETLEMFMQHDIDAERNLGKDFCANQKLKRAHEAGLEIRETQTSTILFDYGSNTAFR